MEKFVEVPLLSFGGTSEDEALGSEHDDALIFIHLEFFTGNDGALCCSDAEANAGDYGDADTGGAADVVRWSATCFVEDGLGSPESVFIWFLHEGVGN